MRGNRVGGSGRILLGPGWLAARFLGVGLAGALSLGLAGCKKTEAVPTSDKTDTNTQAAPVSVHFAKVEQRVLPQRLEVSGTLDADQQSELAAQSAGTVLLVNVDLGTRVKKGDVIVELDPREASLKLQSASASAQQQRARLGLDGKDKFDAETVADVRAAKEALDLANTELARSEALLKDGAIPKAQYDQTKSNRDRAAAQYDVAKNSIDQSYAGLSGADAQAGLSAKTLADTKIRAPFDGVIAEKRISPGEYANVGRVVAVLVKDDPLRLRFDVSESNMASMIEGAKVELHVAAFPGVPFEGVIKRVGASVRVQSRTLPVEAEVQNAKRELKPGLFARASIALGGDPVPTLLVPKSSLVKGASGSRLFVKSGSRVVERLVVTGSTLGDLVEVKGQVNVGEEVAVDGVDKLADGAPITPL